MLTPAFAFVLLAGACYMAFSGRAFDPATVMFSAAWGMMLLLYALLGGDYEYQRWVMAFTIACVSGWLITNLTVSWLLQREADSRAKRNRYYAFAYLRTFLVTTFVIGMCAPLVWAKTTGINLSEITNFEQLLSAAQDAHLMLAQQRVEQDIVNKICLLVALAGVLITGIYLGVGRPGVRISNVYLILPVLPYLSMMLLTTLRTMLVLPILIMFGGWIAGLGLTGRDQLLFRRERLIKIGIAVSFMIVVIVYLQGVRVGDYTFSRVDQTFVKMRIWAASYEPGLVVYMMQVWDHKLKWGASSFRLVAGVFGADDTKMVYGQGALAIGMGEETNSMTALRFILDDFGLYGSVVFCAAWGALTALVAQLNRTGRFLWSPIYALLLVTALFSPNSWFLNYGARVLSPFVVIAYMALFVRGSPSPIFKRRRRSELSATRRSLAAEG